MNGAQSFRLVAGGMLAMGAVFGFGRFVYTPILPHMIADGLSPTAAGLLASANYIGYLASALLGITGVMQRGVRNWFVASIALSGLCLYWMAGAESVGAMFVLRFLSGAGSAVVMVAGATLVFGALASAGSWYAMAPFCGVGFGIAGSSLLVSLLAAHGATWRTMWSVSGIVATVATVAIAFLIPAQARASAAEQPSSAGPIVWSQRLALLTLSYGLFGFGYIITATFIVVITRETPILMPLEPYIWAIVGLAGAASIPVWSVVARRCGDVPTYALACLTEATGVALSVVHPTPVTVVISAIFVGGTFMAITAIGLQIGRRLAGGAPQRIQALMTAAFGIGQIVGPVIAGPLRESTGSFLWSSLAAAAALAVGATLALVP